MTKTTTRLQFIGRKRSTFQCAKLRITLLFNVMCWHVA